MSETEIYQWAARLAGAAWDDRERKGTLADQLRAVAGGDLAPEERWALRWLADAAEHPGDTIPAPSLRLG